MDKGEIIIYQASDGTTSLEVRLEEETVWLTQEQIAYIPFWNIMGNENKQKSPATLIKTLIN